MLLSSPPAVLASLDEDARSWAQLQFDVGEDEASSVRALTRRFPSAPAGPPSGAPLAELSVGELLRRGRAPLEEFVDDLWVYVASSDKNIYRFAK